VELAGLNIVMDADFEPVYAAFNQAKSMAQGFASDLKNVLNGIPDLGKRLNFTSNGASQAAQDIRELAYAKRLEAGAELDRARAQDIADRAAQRASRTNGAAKDEYAQLVAQNQALVREYYNAAASIIRYGDAAGITAERLEQLRVAAHDGQQQLQQIEQGVGRFQRNVGNYASGNAALAQQLRQITTEIPNFFISATIGMQSLSNNLPGIFNELTRIREANQALAASGQPTVSVFKQFLASFNPLNIAIGVGVGLLTAYGPKLWDLAKGGAQNAEILKRQKEQQEAFNNATQSANKWAADQIGQLRAWLSIMADANLSMRQRTIAYDAAVKAYPAYLDKVSKDSALNGGLADVINEKLIPAIIAAAKARAYQEKINYLTAQNIDLEEKQRKQIEDKAKAQVRLNNALISAKQAAADADPQGAGLRGATRMDVSEAKGAINDLTDAINDNSAARINNSKQIERFTRGLNSATEAAGDLNKEIKEPKTRVPGVVHDLTTALDDLLAKNKEVDLLLSDGSIQAEEALTKKLANYKAYIQEITKTSKFKVGIDDSRVSEANEQIKSLANTLDRLKKNNNVDDILQKYNTSIQSIDDNRIDGVITDVEALNQTIKATNSAKKDLLKIDSNGDFGNFVTIFSNKLQELKEQLSDAELQEDGRKLNATFESIENQLGYGLITASEAAAEKVSALRTELKKLIDNNKNGSNNQAIEDLNEQLKQAKIDQKVSNLTDSLNSTLKSSLAESAEILGQGIGNLIAGTGCIGDIFKGIASMLAEQMITFGKQIIEAAVAFQIAQGALKALVANPALAALAGGGLIIAGEVIKSQLAEKSKNIGKFADGGLAYGKTLGVFGEYSNARSNPEVVAPLDKLQSILKNSVGGNREPVVMIPDVQIKGADIYLSFTRYQKGFQR